ncbi:hypothetical protein BJ166DRAFT_593662 [Pestalotiopsis sp. NC0098]|nr:hypothetical protein BJ166DRAFT_593662 [Pestalotiopsis sp. NC0098]
MCQNIVTYCPYCGLKNTDTVECSNSRNSSCWFFACFGSGECEEIQERKVKITCRSCSHRHDRAQQLGDSMIKIGFNTRDSYVDPVLGRALAGLPGSDLYSYNPRYTSGRRPQEQQYNSTNWPAQRREMTQMGNNRDARPVRQMPALTGQQYSYASQQPMSASVPRHQYTSPQAMSASAPRPKAQRAPKPSPIQVRQPAHHVRRPVVVQAPRVPAAHSARVVEFVPRSLPRRDSNGVSEFGSDDGDSPGFRNYKVSPREVSPLHQSQSGYQSWPAYI